ncbi:TM2 domain-containing protein [Streptomyces sp. NBC_01465]|uniref:TM2 domain-containing protein n=1 Tax=Streptomyces sp. NBC_01465 TaxID=2903878 RepID=UPI002E30C111|nr:TM2 domain-containing protein [Streptomyces sp. NBC_01465]
MSEQTPSDETPQDRTGQGPAGGQTPPQDANPYGQQQPPQGANPYGQQPPYGYPYPPPPGTYTGDPAAPYGYDRYGRPYSDKSKIVAGLLQFFLGCFGAGRFYTGHTGIAIAQLCTCGGLGIWALVDAIIMLASDNATDSDGRVLRGG